MISPLRDFYEGMLISTWATPLAAISSRIDIFKFLHLINLNDSLLKALISEEEEEKEDDDNEGGGRGKRGRRRRKY